MSDSLQPYELHHTRLPCPSLSPSLLKLMSTESVMPSSHLILCPLLLLPSVFPSIRVFSNESALHNRWPKYWSLIISPSKEERKKVLVIQLCPNLCDPLDCSPPGFSVQGIFQARIPGVGCHFLLQGIFPFRIDCFDLLAVQVKVKSLSRVRLFATPWAVAHQAPQSMGFSRQ